MSVFETLYLLFKGDTSDLKKSTEDAIKYTKKTKEELSNIDKSATEIGRNFGRLVTQFTGAIAGFLSAQAVISGFKNAIDYDITLGKTARLLGVNVEKLDIWSRAVERAGGSSEDFQQSLRGVAQTFHTTPQIAFNAFPQIADNLRKLNRYAGFTFGKSIGLTEPTILLLQKSGRELDAILKRQRELGVVTKQSSEIALLYNNELLDLNVSFRTLYNSIVIDSLPAFKEFFTEIEKGLSYLTQHKQLVIGAFIGIGGAATYAAFAFGLITAEGLLLTGIVGVLIALFAIFYDDLQVYLNGGKSLTGDLIAKWNEFVDALGLSNAEINTNKSNWEEWGKTVSQVIKDAVSDLLDLINPLHHIYSLIQKVRDIKNGNYGNSPEALAVVGIANSYVQSASETPLNSFNYRDHFYDSAFNKNFVINSMPISVITQATDAEGIARDVGLKFSDQFALAQNNYSTNQAI